MALRDILAIKEQNKYEESLLEFLCTENILTTRVEEHLAFLDRNFSNNREVSRRVIENIDIVIGKEPQLLLDAIHEFFSKSPRFIKLYQIGLKSRKEKKGLYDKMELIANIYEISSILKFGAYLLSDCKDSYYSFRDNNQEKILKYYSNLGLSKDDKNNIRLLRNSASHLLEIRNGVVVFPDGESISCNEVDILYQKINDIFSWWATLIVTALWYNLKLCFIVLNTAYYIAIKSKKTGDEFKESLSILFPEFANGLEKQDKEKQAKNQNSKSFLHLCWKKNKRKLKNKLFSVIGYEDYNLPYFYRTNFKVIFPNIKRQLLNVTQFLEDSSQKIEKESYRENILATKQWLESGSLNLEYLMEQYEKRGSDIFLDGT